MKLANYISVLFILGAETIVNGQSVVSDEQFGQTLHAGAGFGYYRYVGYPVPVIYAGFEMQIDKTLTLEPMLLNYSYQSSYLWGDEENVPKKYNYSETVTIAAVKTTYYFDELLKAGNRWDFYAAASMGFAYRKTNWETGYPGKKLIEAGMGPLYLNVHIGTQYHFSKTIGLQFDTSAGMTTLGLAVHFN